jgi:hypothetical protein
MGASFWLAFTLLLIGVVGLLGAIMGYRSNRRAIDDAWAREWAAQRPAIYPVLLDDWLSGRGGAYQGSSNNRLFPLKNGGEGLAINVTGALTVTAGASTRKHQILGSTIAAGDLLNARLVPPAGMPADWASAHGAVVYRDLAGVTYEQPFTLTREPGGELELTLDEPTHTRGSLSPDAKRPGQRDAPGVEDTAG